jgi:tetratricopeptide (TPR) repeat protein
MRIMRIVRAHNSPNPAREEPASNFKETHINGREENVPAREQLREAMDIIETFREVLDKSESLCRNTLALSDALMEELRKVHRSNEISNKLLEETKVKLEEARGQLHGGQSQLFQSGIPIPIESSESEPSEPCEPLHLSVPSNFIMEHTWLKEPGCPTPVTEAEYLVEHNQYQRALAHLDINHPPTQSVPHHINAILLKACILRTSKLPQRGLELAENALYLAHLNNLQELTSKAQLYRGLCLFDLGLFADAGYCFTQAASIHWFARSVPKWTKLVEQKRVALSDGSEGKRRSPDFQRIPLTTSASGFGSCV